VSLPLLCQRCVIRNLWFDRDELNCNFACSYILLIDIDNTPSNQIRPSQLINIA